MIFKMSEPYTLRYKAPDVQVSNETLDQIREKGCEPGMASEDIDCFRLRRLWNEMEFLAFRLNQMQSRMADSIQARTDIERCTECGSTTVYFGKLIHFTDCKAFTP